MAEIKTVTSIANESSVKFADFYQFAWIKNLGSNTAYVSNKSGITAGGADVAEVGAGDAVMIVTETDTIYVKGATTLEIHAQNFAESPFSDIVIQGGEEPVLITKNITANGTYNASADNADGYSQVTVDVQEQPWQPLEDGYSNFWFELTNDTLSPWLNFSAKNNDAVIDWGDGSGEVALDTLTPTHTYAKAGKYVVKVKGVTGISMQGYYDQSRAEKYMYNLVLKAIEINNEISSILQQGFWYAYALENIAFSNTSTTLGNASFRECLALKKVTFISSSIPVNVCNHCYTLTEVVIPNATTIGSDAFTSCVILKKVTIGSNITSLGDRAFYLCASLNEIHIQATTPPTLGSSIFVLLSSNFVIYVPVGTLSAYQSAWSAYADHIVEEGGQLTRAQLRNIEKGGEASPDEDMR